MNYISEKQTEPTYWKYLSKAKKNIIPKFIFGGTLALVLKKRYTSAKANQKLTFVLSIVTITCALFVTSKPAYAETQSKKHCIKADLNQFKETSIANIQNVFYFAYGSNLSADFFRERLKDGKWLPDGWHKTGNLKGPTPKDYGTFILPDYEFGYSLDLGNETTGNIIPKKGSKVYGVIYEITQEQLLELDLSEDVPIDYNRVAVKVYKVSNTILTFQDAWVYIGNQNKYTHIINPDPEYVELLVNSATQRNFPVEYIQQYLNVPEVQSVAQ